MRLQLPWAQMAGGELKLRVRFVGAVVLVMMFVFSIVALGVVETRRDRLRIAQNQNLAASQLVSRLIDEECGSVLAAFTQFSQAPGIPEDVEGSRSTEVRSALQQTVD